MSVPVRSIAPPAPQRLAGCLALSALAVALLAGCAGPSTKAQRPAGRVVTGDIEQWKEHISEASRRFDIPEEWIRAVMRVESGGRSTMDGRPIISRAGAMGLMQVMPGTYEDLRVRHGLGSDPYNPRDNILAGTAYLREMYDQFGAPGFLGAYNCGPACYADYMAGIRRLPSETRNYIAMIS